MTRTSDESRRQVVRSHIQDGRTIASLVAEYGISRATVSNWVRSYCEECQNNDERNSQLDILWKILSLSMWKIELEKRIAFKKEKTVFAKGINSWRAVSFMSAGRGEFTLRNITITIGM